jgi:hypothetical protein
MTGSMSELSQLINLDLYPLGDAHWRARTKDQLAQHGCVALTDFLRPDALSALQVEAQSGMQQAYFNPQHHNVYLTAPDDNYAEAHIRNRHVLSTKGCITDDQISEQSVLKVLYHSPEFKAALSDILHEDELYPYADSLSSVNIHYARTGEELGWHFDNSSFAVTLMISPATAGGAFEFVRDVRNAETGDMAFDAVDDIVSGKITPSHISMPAGALLLFRGRNSLHRVTPVSDDSVRQLAVLAYNQEPGIALSETAQKTFYGRVGYGRINAPQ